MNIINNSSSFRGYTNVISNQISDDKFRFGFFAAELNDADGFQDLTEYKRLQRLAPQLKTHSSNDNVLFSLYTEIPQGQKLFLNTKSMYFGDELNAIKSELPKEYFAGEECATLKAYTLLASLSRRMMQNSLCVRDAGIGQVFQSAMVTLSVLIDNQQKAFKLLEEAVFRNQKLDILGDFFNTVVQKSMRNYFK